MDTQSKNRKRPRLQARFGRACWICRCKDGTTLDHLVPRAFGGSHKDENLRLACEECNNQRRHRMALTELLHVAAHPYPARFYRPIQHRPRPINKFVSVMIKASNGFLGTLPRESPNFLYNTSSYTF